MKMDKFGYWIMNDVVKPLIEKPDDISDPNDTSEYEPDIEIFTDNPEVKEKLQKMSEAKPVLGSCTLSIRFNNHGEYLLWKKYFGIGRTWDFIVSYPAIMRAEYRFKNSFEVEVMAKKVVQLLEAGFDVHSASWRLDKPEKNEEDE